MWCAPTAPAHLTSFALDATDAAALARHLADHPVDAVISSLPYYCNVGVAEAARRARTHYFDLTEDVEVTRAVRAIAAGAAQAFVPAVRTGARASSASPPPNSSPTSISCAR